MKKPESIADTAVACATLADRARSLADRLRDHKRSADHRSAAVLHAVEIALRDFVMALSQSEAALSPAVKAAISTR